MTAAVTRAILLAAGRGERMRPLTDTCPKPLLAVRGKALIAWHLEALARAGVRRVVINTAWLEARFPEQLGDGRGFGLEIVYSFEGRDHGGALETAGGLKKALPLLALDGDEPFWYVAADVHAPAFAFAAEPAAELAASADWGHLFMVPNPPEHPEGDFGLDAGRLVAGAPGTRLTWSGLALLRPAFVHETMAAWPVGTPARLRPCLDAAIAAQRLRASPLGVPWSDAGTPGRLEALQGS